MEMMPPAACRALVLGGPGAGKTTYLVQLHGRVRAGSAALRARSAPASLEAIEGGYRRLQQGLAVSHTQYGTDATLTLAAMTADGTPVDVVVPDYAGEELRRLVDDRRFPDRWREQAASGDHWLLFIRLSIHPELPDVITRPIGELARAADPRDDEDPHTLPVDMWAVELLQALLATRYSVEARLPRFTLVLSCWDELDPNGAATPQTVATDRLALVDSYCRATWGAGYSVFGLSAQGQQLDEEVPAEEFLDSGPDTRGWIVTPEGAQDSDLTRLVAPS